ncbi:MAG TPA: hypothetical protein VN327_10710 [Pseudonocardiaceae bacterium]|jgi:hypothetical protein|nr:hypothetical protein [Pseudonocardiaceae bacterium]
MTGPSTAPFRDDPGTTACPICQAYFTPVGRQIYCSTPCRKTAFRRRHQNATAEVTIPPTRHRRDYTIYQCPDCGERLYGEQHCPDCGSFARRVGLGGPCPHCDHPVALSDLLDQEATITTNR